MNRRLQNVLLAALSAGLVPAAAARQYSIIDLGTLGGPASAGFGVNASGHAVGASTLFSGADIHGMFSAGSPQELLPLPGDTQCWAMAVSGSDTAIAVSFAIGALVPHGMIWHNGTVTSLGGLSPRAINSPGVIVGSRSIPDADYGQVERAASWAAGVVTDLPTLGGGSAAAMGVNDAGQIVGWSFTTRDLRVHAALWQGSIALDLGTLGGARSQAYAINNAGQVVGWAATPMASMHAVLTAVDASGNVLSRTDLGTLGDAGTSAAYAINASGTVVGTSNSRAVRWNGGPPIDLNTLIGSQPNWVLERARSISDSGHIVGSGVYLGQPRAFLLVPGCYANCDGSSVPPVLTANDFACFLNAYASGQSYADCDGVGGLTANDFVCFINAFSVGCP